MTGFDSALTAWGLAAARCLPVALAVPAFAGTAVPAMVRVGLGLGLAALAAPHLVGVPVTPGPVLLALFLARELLVGFTLGYVASCVFRAAEMAGRLIDISRGANLAEVIAPLSEERSSPAGALFLLLTVVTFLELGGLPYLASALVQSYDAVPLAGAVSAHNLTAVAGVVMTASAGLLEAAVGLAAPALVALLLADLVLGAVARVAPQLPIYFVGMPGKALAGTGVFLLALGSLEATLRTGFTGWARLLHVAVAAWR